MDFHRLKSLAKILTYSGVVLTTGLSIYSLRLETVVKSVDPLKPNKFTPSGKRYLAALLLSAMITIASSWMENYADNKISDEASKALQTGVQLELQKQLGSQLTQFNTALATKEKDVTDSLADLAKGVRNANSALQTSVDSTTRIMRNNNIQSQAQARHTRESLRDVQLASRVLSSFSMNISLPGAKPTRNASSESIRAADYAKMEKMQEILCGDSPPSSADASCNAAFQHRKSWDETFDFFSYLDPTSHLEIQITFRLSGFYVNITDWDQPYGRGETVRAPSIMIVHTDSSNPNFQRTSTTWSGGSPDRSLGITFGLEDPGGGLEKGKTYYSRETDLVTFEFPFQVKLCDKHDKSEDMMMVDSHLASFPSQQIWELTITGFEKTEAEHPEHIEKKYILDPGPVRRQGNCAFIDYQ